MKRKIYLLILIAVPLIVPQSIIAQSNRHVFSVVAGLTRSSISGEGDSWHPLISGQAGIILTVANFNETVSFRVELNGSMEGARWEDNTLKGSTQLLYANAPLVVRYQHKSGFFGEAGIQPGLLLSAKDKYSGGDSYDLKDNLKKIDLGIPIGVGYEFQNNFGVGLRLIPGILSISKEGGDEDRNFVMALRGTYTFRKK